LFCGCYARAWYVGVWLGGWRNLRHVVQFSAITGRQDRNFGDAGTGAGLLQRLLHNFRGERNLLTHGNRRGIMIYAQYQKGHEEKDLK
jgi:hypothetical protein